MVKDHSDNERGNLLLPLLGLLFPSSNKGCFVSTTPQTQQHIPCPLLCQLWNTERERNVLFNDALNSFYLGYMVSDIWLRTILNGERKPAAAT